MKDQTIQCKDCGAEFVWTANEQEFYKEKGFNAPIRCKDCRVKARAAFGGGDRHNKGGFGGQRQSFSITCAQCGAEDTVPFKPRGDKPVLCRNCFQKNR